MWVIERLIAQTHNVRNCTGYGIKALYHHRLPWRGDVGPRDNTLNGGEPVSEQERITSALSWM